MTDWSSELVSAGLDPDPGITGVTPPAPTVDGVPARRASRSVLAVFVLRVATATCGLAVTVVLARHLGPARFGELSLILTVAILVSSIAELGTTSVVAAEMAAHPERRRQLAAGVVVLRSGVGAVLAVAGALLLVMTLDRTEARWAAAAVLATVPLAGLSALAVLAQARLRPEVGAALSLGQSAAWLVAVVLVAAAGADLAVVGAAFLASIAGQAAATWLVVARRERPAWGAWGPAVHWTLAHSWPLAVAAVLGAAYYRLDVILVYQLQGAAEAGLYGAAYRFLDVSQLVPLAVVSVLLPLLARRWAVADRVGFEAAVRLGVTASAAVGGLLTAGAVVCGDRVALAVLGAGFDPSGDVLRILGPVVFSLATGYVYAAALIASGDVKVVGLTSAVALLVSVAAGVPAISAWGAVGAAWVTVGSEFLVSTTLGVWLHRRHRLRFPWDRVRGTLGAAAVLAGVGWPLRGLPVVLLLAVCVTAYCAAAARFGAVTGDDVRALAHRTLALGGTG
ncbi:MAG TPA: oligosaccharide flippase family protein [Acidimicrobiales bacterium]|nr:oligosaccharide flippase family protein [Acidimicrobiales bacterium]